MKENAHCREVRKGVIHISKTNSSKVLDGEIQIRPWNWRHGPSGREPAQSLNSKPSTAKKNQ
jgi:hypothetical protein